MKFLVFGSLNIDRTYSVPHFVSAGETMAADKMELFCGGKGFNAAVACARAGKEVYFAGAVGTDGQMLLEALDANGIHRQHVKHTDGPSGHAVIQVDPTGQNCIIVLAGANGEISKSDVDSVLADFAEGDMIVLQNEVSNVDYILRAAMQKGMMVALNPSPLDDRVKTFDLNCVDYLMINEVEGTQLAHCSEPNRIIDILREKYSRMNIVLTLGARGALYCGVSGEQYGCGIYKGNVVDTTSAGDTFCGYFLSHITEHGNPEVALRKASVASGISVTRSGASCSIPLRSEVDSVDLSVLSDYLG